jgi:hypothetical protein
MGNLITFYFDLNLAEIFHPTPKPEQRWALILLLFFLAAGLFFVVRKIQMIRQKKRVHVPRARSAGLETIALLICLLLVTPISGDEPGEEVF